MCLDPVIMLTAATSALSIANTSAQIVQQNKTAEATAKAAAKQAELDYQILEEQKQEIKEQAELEAFERQRQALREEAKIRVAAGEAGVLGNSILRQLNNSLLQAGYDIDIIEANKEAQLAQASREQTASVSRANSVIANAKASSVGPLQAAISMGSAGFSGGLAGYTAGKRLKLK